MEAITRKALWYYGDEYKRKSEIEENMDGQSCFRQKRINLTLHLKLKPTLRWSPSLVELFWAALEGGKSLQRAIMEIGLHGLFRHGPEEQNVRETHTDPAAEDSWRLEWRDRVYFSHLKVRTAGVATLFSPDLWPKVLGVTKAVLGYLLHLRVCMDGLVVNLVNIYAPTLCPERLRFYQQASAFLGTLDTHECLAHSSSIWPALFSDHHLATVTASLCMERLGPAYWHFNNSLLEDVHFMMSFQEFWLAW
ncbi:unnamed protein product [Caretta caretta]